MPESASATRSECFAVPSDGVRLCLTHHRPIGSRRGVALVGHAMMANATYLTRFCRHLAMLGVECFALDFRGHGRSQRPVDWSFADLVERDLPAAVAAAADAASLPASELVYIGHSLGGLVGAAAFARGSAPGPRRLILVATTVWTSVGPGRQVIMAGFRSITRVIGRFPARGFALGTDDEARTYVADLCRWVREGYWPWSASLGKLATPTLVVASDGDPLCRPDEARCFASGLGGNVDFQIVGRTSGDGFNPSHMALLHDPRLAGRWSEIARFACGCPHHSQA